LRDQRDLPKRRDVKVRLRQEEGFGLIELTIAMAMLNIGILAIIAAFNSGAIALKRSSHISTGAAIADAQMEIYRGLLFSGIGFTPANTTSLDNTYKCDTSLGASCPNTVTTCDTTSTCTDGNLVTYAGCGTGNECSPTRTVTAANSPDHYPYRVDTYITYYTPSSGKQLKKITVVVRDGNNAAYTFARVTSTFDAVVNS
jgi:type II secretory pathway pseudopilin PulG